MNRPHDFGMSPLCYHKPAYLADWKQSEQEFQSVLDGLNSRKYPETPAAFGDSLPNKPIDVNAAEAPELAAAQGAGANKAVELRPIQGRDGAFGYHKPAYLADWKLVTGVKNTADIRKNDLGELVKFHKGDPARALAR